MTQLSLVEIFSEVLNLIIELAEECAKDPWELNEKNTTKEDNLVTEKYSDIVTKAYKIKDKKIDRMN